VRGTQNAHRQPTTPLDGRIKGDILDASIGHNILASDRLAVHDQFDRHLARVANASPLDVPVGLLVRRPVVDTDG
jgi:hypothetical protein